MERLEEVVPDCNYQSLQHFTSHSEWDARAVLDQAAREADRHFGGSEGSAPLLDESAFAKKGEKSVGVARQWNGKVENSQVAMFAALAQGPYSTLIDTRLYLPKEWLKNPERCREAGAPETEMVSESKAELAFEMVVRVRQNGIRFSWVGMDAGYGKDPALLRRLADHGEVFVADVHKDQQIYLEDPDPTVPQRRSPRGKRPKRLEAQRASQRVDEWMKAQPSEFWRRVMVRPGSKGELQVEALHARVWLWDGKEPRARCWHMVAMSPGGGVAGDDQVFLSNAAAETSLERLVQMQRQRFWIERSFEDGKSESGMADY